MRFPYHHAARLFPDILWSRPGPENTVYLTFDDGPDPVYTPQVLDLLARYRIPATFFLIGRRAQATPSLVEAVHQAGHTIGMHSMVHSHLWYRSATYISQDVREARDVLASITGHQPRLYRPPYGHFSPRLIRICHQFAVTPVMWTCMPFDFHGGMPEVWVFRLASRALANGTIYVLHDGHENSHRTIRLLPRLIDHGLEHGYQFHSLAGVRFH